MGFFLGGCISGLLTYLCCIGCYINADNDNSIKMLNSKKNVPTMFSLRFHPTLKRMTPPPTYPFIKFDFSPSKISTLENIWQILL